MFKICYVFLLTLLGSFAMKVSNEHFQNKYCLLKPILCHRTKINVKMTLTKIVSQESREENVMEVMEAQTPTQRPEEPWQNAEDLAEDIMLIYKETSFQI